MGKASVLLKTKLTKESILHAPNWLKFVVQTDASNKGIGGFFAAEGSEEHSINYVRRKFTDPERSFSPSERECAEIIFP